MDVPKNGWMYTCAKECMNVHIYMCVCEKVDNVLNKTCACMYTLAQIELTSIII